MTVDQWRSAATSESNFVEGTAVVSMFQLKDAKGNIFSAVKVGRNFRLADGRALEYIDAADTFRIEQTDEVLMRPYP